MSREQRMCRESLCYGRARLLYAAMRTDTPTLTRPELPGALMMHLLVAIDEKTFAACLNGAISDVSGGKG